MIVSYSKIQKSFFELMLIERYIRDEPFNDKYDVMSIKPPQINDGMGEGN